jgi:beta-aspartyl-peptidase (threonine type)
MQYFNLCPVIATVKSVPVPAIAIHTGAGRKPRDPESLKAISEVISAALDAGMKVARTGSALDMVVEAVKVLEDSGVLNAGTGSTVDLTGSVSMDAGVAYSKFGRAGAVAFVKYPRNPVVLARYILENTDHVLVVGDAADRLAERLGLPRHPGVSEKVRKMYEEAKQKILAGEVPQRFYSRSQQLWLRLFGLGDTVGAVAVDSEHEVAAATSTGGVFLKMPGRVGDSPIYGAGLYATSCGAASATGIGEYIIMFSLSLRTVERMCGGRDPAEASEEVMKEFTARFGDDTAGIIVIDRDGRAHGAYNTPSMPWGYASKDVTKIFGL